MKYSIRIGERIYQVEIVDPDALPVEVMVDGEAIEVWPESNPARAGARPTGIQKAGIPPVPTADRESTGQPAAPRLMAKEKKLRAPLPGVILSVKIEAGDQVSPGHEMFIIESMKMRNAIRSNRAGKVAKLHVVVGQTVNHNDVLVEFEEQAE